MERIKAKSESADRAYGLVESLQARFVKHLNEISKTFGENRQFESIEWFRDEGKHGGGVRFVATDDSVFNRGSVNISQVQYDNDSAKELASASAISTIIHPKNPLAPSVHIHISWTELKNGKGYWRIMADLNPSVPFEEDKIQFADALKNASPEQYEEAAVQGDRYFYIPVLGRHRGVTHYYLENYNTGDFEKDYQLARTIGETAIDTYSNILQTALASRTQANKADYEQQLEYHTLYLFQVLTLDRGTTSGLLIHNQNDVGIMGSIPSQVNRRLLASWLPKMQKPQDELLQAIISCLPENDVTTVEDDTKQKLANAVRDHYLKHPEAIQMQASGNSVPTTVDNHK